MPALVAILAGLALWAWQGPGWALAYFLFWIGLFAWAAVVD